MSRINSPQHTACTATPLPSCELLSDAQAKREADPWMGYDLPIVLFEPLGTGALAANQKSKRRPALCSFPCSGTSCSVASLRASLPPATPDCDTHVPHSAHTTRTCFERPWEAKTDFTFKTLLESDSGSGVSVAADSGPDSPRSTCGTAAGSQSPGG